jgi:hypothetical protein
LEHFKTFWNLSELFGALFLISGIFWRLLDYFRIIKSFLGTFKILQIFQKTIFPELFRSFRNHLEPF